jgi:hypothetical protein
MRYTSYFRGKGGWHIAQKRYTCSWCEEAIEKGERYRRDAWLSPDSDEPFVESKMHEECERAHESLENVEDMGPPFDYFDRDRPQNHTQQSCNQPQ